MSVLRLPRRDQVALAAVMDVALNARPQPVSAKLIAERLHVPPRYLEQIMQPLVRAGILKGQRGPKGGYALARERRRITPADILRALSAEADAEDAIHESPFLALWWDEVAGRVEAVLEETTLEDLIDAQAAAEPARTLDFTI